MVSKTVQRGRGRHPIQVVVTRTGLEADRIRQWERRYGAVAPPRSEGGHRLYSDEDVERLRLLARVVEGGRRIGDVAKLTDAELSRLVLEDAEEGAGAHPSPGEAEDSAVLVEESMQRILALDANGLDAVLRSSLSRLGVRGFVLQAVAPLLERIGSDWESGSVSPSYEHMATAELRRVLTDAVADAGGPVRGPTLVVATPQGTVHELGALMVAALAAAEGWAVVFLGADLPAQDIADVALACEAKAIALSIVHPPADPEIAAELQRLVDAIPRGLAVIVGGRAAASYHGALKEGSFHQPRLDRLPGTLASLR